MCGRIVLSQNPENIQSDLNIQRWQGRELYRPSFNVAPTNYCPIVVVERTTEESSKSCAEPVLISMKWGLSSPWMNHQPINIRSDNKGLKLQKRCIVLTEGFYEWYRKGSMRQPYYIFRENTRYVLMAGVYEMQTNQNGDQHYTFAVVTTDASEPMSTLHHRMPVIFPSLTSPEAQLWLSPEKKWNKEYDDLLKSFEEDLTWYKVSPEVNKVSNDSKRCTEKLEESKTNIKNFFQNQGCKDPTTQEKKEFEVNGKDSTHSLDQRSPAVTQARIKTEQEPSGKQAKRLQQEADKPAPKQKFQKITHFFQAK